MDITQQQQIYIGIAIVAIILILLVIRHYSNRLQILSNQNNDLNTQLALRNQAFEQLEHQHQETGVMLDDFQRRSNELQQSLHSSEKANQALSMELGKRPGVERAKISAIRRKS